MVDFSKYVSKRPKLDVRSKQTVERKTVEGHYFQRIDDHDAQVEAERSVKHTWSGFLPLSGGLKWRMCMDDVYDKLIIKEEKDQVGRHYTDNGTALHTMMEKKSKKVPGLLWHEFPNVPDNMLAWQIESWPEVVGECNVRGVRFKADAILNVQGEIGVFDLKNSNQAFDKWNEFVKNRLPKTENLIQVAAYADVIEGLNYYPGRQVKWVGIGYQNVTNHRPKDAIQKVEFWYPFDDYLRHKTRTLLYYLAQHRRHALMGRRERCNYTLCSVHGDF